MNAKIIEGLKVVRDGIEMILAGYVDENTPAEIVENNVTPTQEVKKSKKLLCSQVKIGSQVKQIVSGIKLHYSAEEMVGKKVMVW